MAEGAHTKVNETIPATAQLTFTCSKLTMETLEKRCEIC